METNKDITIKYLCDRAKKDFPDILKQDPFMNFTIFMTDVDLILKSGKPIEEIRNGISGAMTTYSIVFLAQSLYAAEELNDINRFATEIEQTLTHIKTCNEVSVAMSVSGHKLDKDSLERFGCVVKGFRDHSTDIDELFNKEK